MMQTGINHSVGEINLQIIMDSVICSKPSSPSKRMGASSIGESCERALWLKFHWALDDIFEGDTLRTFELGSMMEGKIVEWLKDCGLKILYTGKEQIELNLGPHLVCYPDGLVTEGVPTAEKTEHALEIKTMCDKYFKELKKKGLKKSQPKHYAQMQLEMLGLSEKLGRKIERALYVVFNKDTSEIHAIRVYFDKDEAEALLRKAERIRTADALPPGVSSQPEWYECEMCRYSHFCHFSHEIMKVNCRTCAHSTPEEDGTWSCQMDKRCGWGIGSLTAEMQKTGCDFHCFNPSLVPYPFHEDMSTEYSAAFEMPDGSIVLNGYGGVNSHELWKTGRITYSDEQPIEDIPY